MAAEKKRGWWQRAERELDAELRDHFERLVSEYRAGGLSEPDARRRARLEFGGLDQAKEQCRDVRRTRWLADLAQDARYGARGLQRHPGFAFVAIFTLALGIGASIAVLSVMNALLLRPLPVHEPGELVWLQRQIDGQASGSFSYPQVRALAEHAGIFPFLCGFGSSPVDVGSGDALRSVGAAWVSGRYYDTLGLSPQVGRLLIAADDEPGAAPVVVISDDYWTRRFARDVHVVGQTIAVEGVPVPIVGVSPAGFVGANVGEAADVTLSIQARAVLRPDQPFYLGPGGRWLRVLARPRPGLSAEEAQAQVGVVWTRHLEASLPSTMTAGERNRRLTETVALFPGRTGTSPVRGQFRVPLTIAFGFVLLVLLIACANVANLLLAHGATRAREIAVRLSIGASHGRVVRQLLTESAVIALAGALAGSWIAWAGSHALVDLMGRGSAGPDGATLVLDLTPDWLMVAATFAIVTAATLLFGMAPAWRASRIEPGAALAASGRVTESRRFLGPALVATQVALSLALVVGAGLFVRTLYNLRALDRGFGVDDVLVVEIDAGRAGYTGAKAHALNASLLAFIEGLPGVRAASVAAVTPLKGGGITQSIAINGAPNSNDEVHFNIVGPRYFDVIGTVVVAGRDFRREDTPTASFVAIVNEAFVRQFMAGANPLGQRLSTVGASGPTMEIVGVVQDAVYESLREPPPPTVYSAHQQRTATASFVIHAPGAVADTAAAVRAEIRSRLGGRVPRVRLLAEQLESSLVLETMLARVAVVFGLLALTLAAIGLYGVTSYWVASRTRELGVRVALGASARQVVRLVFGATLRPIIVGIVVGIFGAWGLSRLVATMVFGLSATDSATIAFAVAVIALTGLLAGVVPAHRATRIDPQAALRNE